PGSFAVYKGEPVQVSAGGLSAVMYLRSGGNHAQEYASEFGRAFEYFTGVFGLAPNRRLTVVETEAGSPNGYSGPGIVFLSPATVNAPMVNARVVANQM